MTSSAGGQRAAEAPALIADPMPVRHKLLNLAAIVTPFVGVVAAVEVAWNDFAALRDLAILAVLYVLTTLGITVGFHRLLTHRSFATYPAIERMLAALGSMATQGPVINWVADHRRHHAFTDREGDPHSPHVHAGHGVRGMLSGLLHAHAGWLLRGESGLSDPRRFARDLLEDPAMRLINRAFPLLVAAGLALPFGLGWALGGTLEDGLTALLWGGLVRVFLLQHMTWSVNSVCHFAGRRRFATDDRSTNVLALALPSLGDSWHHNHHTFPRSAFHGLRWYELDPAGWLIRLLRRLHLAWNVVAVVSERQLEREAR